MGCCCSKSKKNREEKKTMGDHLDDKNRNANSTAQIESKNGTNAIDLEKKHKQWLETEANPHLAEVINTLAIKLYKAIDHQNKSGRFKYPADVNFVFSPIAIAASLTPAELGATENFRLDIQRLIGLIQSESIDSGRTHGDLQDVSWRIPQCGGEIKIVHIICPYSPLFPELTLDPQGLKNPCENFERGIFVKYDPNFDQKLQIPRALASPSKEEWVRVKEKIEEVVWKGTIGTSYIMVSTNLHLVNRTYVKANWEHEFRSEDTRRMPFYEFGIQRKEVEFMRQGPSSSIAYADLGDLHAIEMPLKAANIQSEFKSDIYSMIILLPKLLEGIVEIEKRLTSNWLMKTIDTVHSSRSNNLLLVELPKISARQNIDMYPIFEQLGFRKYDHFERMGDEQFDRSDPTASCKRIARFLEAEHRVTLEIDHEHPKPSSTPDEVTYQIAPPTPTVIKFTCDHPFLFVIINKRSKVIMLMGKVNRIEDLK